MSAPSSKLIQAIMVTTEVCGRTFTPAAANVFAADLSGFPEDFVLMALDRCRKEVKGALTGHDVISRIDDGRPGVEEAWAMLPSDEEHSISWTAEMRSAWGVAKLLIDDGDRVAARMAFKEKYTKDVNDARDKRRPVSWEISLGNDKAGRQMAIADAIAKKRLGLSAGLELCAPHERQGLLLSLGVKNHPLLSPPSTQDRQKLKSILLTLQAKQP